MSEPVKMRIEYYPARKSIDFILFEAGGKVVTTTYDKLTKYSTDERGKFVLNLHGNEFFDDIMKPFYGKSCVQVSIKTTREDYEDFKLMVDSYNKSYDKEITIRLCDFTEDDELPDMQQVFSRVKNHGDRISELLDKAYLDIGNIKCASQDSRTYISKVAERIKNASDKIKEKRSSLDDNRINLCFIGAYDAGKSSLINAILGYRILPVSIESKTAKIMRIIGVHRLAKSYIKFSGKEKGDATIVWDMVAKQFKFSECSLGLNLRSEMQEVLNRFSDKDLYEQIYGFLNTINDREDMGIAIDIGFPIPLEKDGLQYSIIDTPGADSDYESHKDVLRKALSEQENSIAIFVIKPDGIEGRANNMLLGEILKQQSEKQSYIDMEQSFFVVNKMDDNNDDNYKLESKPLKVSENNSINLSERKLFFLSARVAYTVRAKKNGIKDEILEDFYDCSVPNCYKSRFGKYYTHNHCGKSQFATERMRKESADALAQAEANNDDYNKYLVCSGIYSLEQEITRYGHRHAVAVKTVALIKSMEAASEYVRKVVTETKLSTGENISEIQSKLDNEINRVKEIISTTKADFCKPPEDINKQLGIDSATFWESISNPVNDELERTLKPLLLSDVVIIDKELEQAILKKIDELECHYEEQYILKRISVLEDTRREFIKELTERINGDDYISKEVKIHLKNFTEPEIPEIGVEDKVEKLFEDANHIDYVKLKEFSAFLLNRMDKNKQKNADSPENQSNITDDSGDAGKGVIKKIFKKTHEVKDHIIDTVEKTLREVNESIQKLQTRHVNKKEFIDKTMKFTGMRQEELTGWLRKEYAHALDDLCEAISSEFSGNIERYSDKVKALKEDAAPVEELAGRIDTLNSDLDSIRNDLKDF